MYWYLQMQQLHVGLVVGMVLLFLIRGAGAVAGARWPMDARLRTLGGGIDFMVTLVGLSLWAMLQVDVLQQPWLLMKFLLLALYILLANVTLRLAQSTEAKLLGYIGALICLGLIVAVARTRLPLAGLAG